MRVDGTARIAAPALAAELELPPDLVHYVIVPL